jgi:hypothetical protein
LNPQGVVLLSTHAALALSAFISREYADSLSHLHHPHIPESSQRITSPAQYHIFFFKKKEKAEAGH